MTVTLAETLCCSHNSCILHYCNSGTGFKVYRMDKLDHVVKMVFALTITVQLVHRYGLKKRKKILP